MRQSSAYDEEVRDFSPPSAANQNLVVVLSPFLTVEEAFLLAQKLHRELLHN